VLEGTPLSEEETQVRCPRQQQRQRLKAAQLSVRPPRVATGRHQRTTPLCDAAHLCSIASAVASVLRAPLLCFCLCSSVRSVWPRSAKRTRSDREGAMHANNNARRIRGQRVWWRERHVACTAGPGSARSCIVCLFLVFARRLLRDPQERIAQHNVHYLTLLRFLRGMHLNKHMRHQQLYLLRARCLPEQTNRGQ
jgi:hypothetical protein